MGLKTKSLSLTRKLIYTGSVRVLLYKVYCEGEFGLGVQGRIQGSGIRISWDMSYKNQRTQYPLIKECTSHHNIKAPII